VRINPKNLTACELDDYANFLFTSNRPNAFRVDDGDRRFFIWEVPESIGRKPTEFFTAYIHWLDKEGGASALLYWLQTRELEAFNPSAPAPETQAKKKMKKEGKGVVANWVADLKTYADDLLPRVDMGRDLFTSAELCSKYEVYSGLEGAVDRNLPSSIARALSAAGFQQVYGGDPVTCKPHKLARYYAIRNAEKWLSASLAEIQAHLRGDKQPTKDKKYVRTSERSVRPTSK
jgi:hypothetical protein